MQVNGIFYYNIISEMLFYLFETFLKKAIRLSPSPVGGNSKEATINAEKIYNRLLQDPVITAKQ
jgi:hypothetical protein